MAATMWRMNGLWRRMAGVLVLCALLLSNEVMCQDGDAATGPTDAPAPPADDTAVTDAAASAAAPDATAAPDTGATATAAAAGGGDSAASGAPGDSAATTVPISVDVIQDVGTSVTLGPAAPTIEEVQVKPVVPGVTCVGKEDIPESNAVKVEVATRDCEATKRVIEANPAAWCAKDSCDLKIFQEGNNMLVTSDDAKLGALAGVLQGETLKDKLGVTKVDTPSSSGSSVFVGILVTGLLAAIAITVGYLKCQRRPETKGVRLAEEAYPADQENQGNTLVSVAPLNPPPETPEKPSANGESPEADKTQPPPPPTNGTSTTKTADTEL